MIIYKITNLINNKVYIGLTSTTLNRRWSAHKRDMNKDQRHLYCAMRKYGIENFIIEEIDSANDFKTLGKLERNYIKLYNSRDHKIGYNLSAGGESNQLDANPRATLTVEEVIQIREIYANCELTSTQCWELYSDKISLSAFKKIWNGYTWTSILPEVYTKENKNWHKHNSPRTKGELNKNALYTNDEVLEIRKYYSNHTSKQVYEKYGQRCKTQDSFRCITNGWSYTNIPIYKKKKKMIFKW